MARHFVRRVGLGILEHMNSQFLGFTTSNNNSWKLGAGWVLDAEPLNARKFVLNMSPNPHTRILKTLTFFWKPWEETIALDPRKIEIIQRDCIVFKSMFDLIIFACVLRFSYFPKFMF